MVLVVVDRVLACQRIVHRIYARLVWHRLDHRLHASLELLVVDAHLGRDRSRRRMVPVVQIQRLKLVGGSRGSLDVDQLLLQLLLPLQQIEILLHEGIVHVRIHLIDIVELGRSQHLLGETVHVLIPVAPVGVVHRGVREMRGCSGLRHVLAGATIVTASETGSFRAKPLLMVGSGRRCLPRGSTKSSKEMRAAGARCRIGVNLVFVDGIHVSRGSNAQPLHVGALSP